MARRTNRTCICAGHSHRDLLDQTHTVRAQSVYGIYRLRRCADYKKEDMQHDNTTVNIPGPSGKRRQIASRAVIGRSSSTDRWSSRIMKRTPGERECDASADYKCYNGWITYSKSSPYDAFNISSRSRVWPYKGIRVVGTVPNP